ncbi:RTA1 domain protein [Penicillium odoratum]|uniref:RTA1 domain protein n=1 Tax=Penicillium odoratum TaxID=1167516 RepID=UPI002546C21E|nr:RTA1 domain protein [Penicillium odoratum]KAJ5768729.1 RTA1 domain protein [Penicillium odoratum]
MGAIVQSSGDTEAGGHWGADCPARRTYLVASRVYNSSLPAPNNAHVCFEKRHGLLVEILWILQSVTVLVFVRGIYRLKQFLGSSDADLATHETFFCVRRVFAFYDYPSVGHHSPRPASECCSRT